MNKTDRLIETVDAVLEKHAWRRADGKVASLRTRGYSKEVMHETCRRLHRLGYLIQNIESINPKHIEAIVKSWHGDGLSNKTMQNQYSRLKIFVNNWLGKNGMVREGGVINYLEGVDESSLKVQTYTDETKSWSGNGLDVKVWIDRARLIDSRFHCMLLMGLAFGLRKKEMLRIKPWLADKNEHLSIDGSVAKNGRHRTIPLEGAYGQFQRQVLDQVKKEVKRGETLGWPNRTLKQNENRYYKYMQAIGATKYESGVTGHGLRAEFAENQAMLMGLIPPSLGGDKKQMTKKAREEITLAVSNRMGHGRVSVLGAYYGTFRSMPEKKTGIGERVGTFVLSEDDVCHVHAWPTITAGPSGEYRKLSAEEKSELKIVLVVEKEEGPIQKMSVEEFDKSDDLSEKSKDRLKKLLEKVGL